MTPTSTPEDADRTESHDSVTFEFTDAAVDFSPRPIRDAVLRHLPGWLRESVAARARTTPKLSDSTALADCLLDQARLLFAMGRHTEAVPRLEEAELLYQNAGVPAGVADCYHVAAKIHEALGQPDKAFDFLRREEELRRGLAA